MQNFKELYQELSNNLTDSIDTIKWVDIWNSQVYNIENEHPFPAPAVFLGFRSNSIKDNGAKVQEVTLQVDVFIFYETFADTYKGSFNQDDALEFLDLIDKVNQLFHGSSGESYSSMRRVSFSPVDTGGAGNLWNITYVCTLIDYSATKVWEKGKFMDVAAEPFDVS
jgi:hypothetical protein